MKKILKTTVILLLVLVLVAGASLPLFALTPLSVTDVYKTSQFYKNLVAVTKTGDMRRDIVAVAKSQLGYHEGNSRSGITGTTSGSGNYTEYGYFFGDYYHNTYLQHAAWCGMYVSWCSLMAGVPESVLYPSTTAQPTGSYSYRFFGSNALSGAGYKTFYDLRVKGGSYTPLPGDIVFYASSAYKGNRTSLHYKHVGIVESVTYTYNDNGSLAAMVITTYEGNTSNKVTNKKWTIKTSSDGRVYSECYIAGFGIPDYTTQTTTPVIDDPVVEPDPEIVGYDIGAFGGTALKRGSAGAEVAKIQMALNVLSLKYPSIPKISVDGDFGPATENAVKAFQSALSLTVDGSFGPASWRAMRSALGEYTNTISGDFVISEGKLLLYKGSSSNPSIPSSVNEIGGAAFIGNKSLKSISIAAGDYTVGPYAFYGCTSVAYASILSSTNTRVITVDASGVITLYVAPVEPDPTPVDPTPVDPTPVDPTPVDPTPVDPTPVDPTPVDPTPDEPTPDDPASPDLATYYIKFQYLPGQYSIVPCKEGYVPEAPEPDPITDIDGTAYIFIGWDKEIVAATCNAKYNAVFVTIPAASVKLSSKNFLCGAGDFITIDLFLTLSEGTAVIPELSITLDFAQYLEYTDFTGFSSNFASVSVAEPALGTLVVTGQNIAVGKNTLLVSLNFALDDRTPDMSFLLEAAEDVSFFGKCEDGVVYAMAAEYALNPVTVNQAAMYDSDRNGELTVNDVSGLLDLLAYNAQQPSVPHASGYIFTISDVTRLLDLLASGL